MTYEILLTIIEASPDFIAIKDAEGRWELANSSGLSAFGLIGDSYKGKTDAEIGEMVSPELAEALNICSKSDCDAWEMKSNHRTLEIVHLPGFDPQYFDVVKVPLFNEDSSRRKLIVFGRNVTELLKGKSSEKFANHLFENSREAILVTDKDANILSVNPMFTELTGYTAEEVIGKNPRILASGRHDESFYRLMWQKINLEKHWHGEVWDRRKNGEIYPKWLTISVVEDGENQVENYIGTFTDITNQKATIDKINFLAHHDPLTKLPNRTLLRDRFEQAAALTTRNNHQMAMMFIDLDNFKEINDVLGHVIGDGLLIEISKKLKECIRESDTLSRMGGDEFVILLPNLTNQNVVQLIAEKILMTLAHGIDVEGNLLHTGCSIGISMFPEEGEDFDTLLKKSDTAMYHAKSGGRNTYRYFTTQMNVDAVARMNMQQQLRNALNEGEFELHYQPQYSIVTGKTIGAEALLRWHNKEMGEIPPDRFIPIAEETGLIVPIGNWVINEVCRQIHEWDLKGYPQMVVAINLSAVQFKRSDLLRELLCAVNKHSISAGRIELELTESILVHDTEEAIRVMAVLNNQGFKLSIDDFGTGYSSLSYLKHFMIHKLKIDQSFVKNIANDKNDKAIVRSIIDMAHSLGHQVIAEGVETSEQYKILANEGCDEFQGYWIGRPAPANHFSFTQSYEYLS